MHCCRSSQGKLGTRSVPLLLNAAATVAAATVCRLNSPPDAVAAAAAVTHELTTAAACWHVGGVACWRLRLCITPPLQGFTLAAQQLLADLREHRLLELLLKEGFVPADHSVPVRSPPKGVNTIASRVVFTLLRGIGLGG